MRAFASASFIAFSALVTFVSVSRDAGAVGTRTFVLDSLEKMSGGDVKGVSVGADGTVRAFGVTQTLDGLEDTPVRSCFLIDADAIIRGAWRYGNDEVPDVEALLAAAHAL